MQLTFLGGADEVGASCTLLDVAGVRVLVDAGIRISSRASRGLHADQVPDLAVLHGPNRPDAIVITHAHTDHIGALPLVLGVLHEVPVYTTAPTAALIAIMLGDANKLMDARFEAEGELPLYDEVAVARTLARLTVVPLGQPVTLGPGVQVTLHQAGHILGAALLAFETREGTLVFSGDVSVGTQRTVGRLRLPRLRADVLVLESTYGGRLHANRQSEERRLVDMLARITADGGRVLIPAFALGRAQEVVQIVLAHRDQFDAPVYVDGMVRAICDVYQNFKEWLPASTVRAAGAADLFFRDGVHAIRTRAAREALARNNTPCVIIASSGMLTGGASAFYAQHIAPDAASAIVLTGYQDEEAPGRFLQTVMRQRQAGQTPVLRLGDGAVPVACAVDTYALSAHADEAELVSVGEALDAARVFLVHGDATARESLWRALQGRKRAVGRPQNGQVRVVEPRRALAMPVTIALDAAAPPEVAALWAAMHTHVGEDVSVRQLAQTWYGDVARAADVASALADDDTYFAQDWKDPARFRVRTPEQVAARAQAAAIVAAIPDLPGQLVVLRDANGLARLAVVEGVTGKTLMATAHGVRGQHYPADALVWPLGAWEGDPTADLRAQLDALHRVATPLMHTLLPPAARQRLVGDGQLVRPNVLLPKSLSSGVTRQTALTAVVLRLAYDGATWTPDGLRPLRVAVDEPISQQKAASIAQEIFGETLGVRKIGQWPQKRTLVLHVDFPLTARHMLADAIEALQTATGWAVAIDPTTRPQALSSAVVDVLPPGARLLRPPSVYGPQQRVAATVEGVLDPAAVSEAYQTLTGWALELRWPTQATPAQPAPPAPAAQRDPRLGTDAPIEINAAYALARATLEPLGLRRVGLKQGALLVTFITPQVAARHSEHLRRLSAETGYPVKAALAPLTNELIALAKALAQHEGWLIRKGPGVHTQDACVTFRLTLPPTDEALQRAQSIFEEATGYQLVVSQG